MGVDILREMVDGAMGRGRSKADWMNAWRLGWTLGDGRRGRGCEATCRRVLWALLACAAALAAACASEPPPEPETPPEPPVAVTSGAVAYRGMRVIPGDGSPAVEDAVMIVDGGRIAALGSADRVAPPPGTTTVDLTGKTLIPALVNLHGHVGFQRGLTYAAENYTRENIVDELRRYLYHGVGTVVSLGTDAGDLWREIQRDQQLGALDGARLYTAGRGLAAPNAGPRLAGAAPVGIRRDERGGGPATGRRSGGAGGVVRQDLG